jgi:hypothetical protein|tara:strand:+ start:323 stop:463 length:141 start_codon:yes stop_codon:yes gene_type:complete
MPEEIGEKYANIGVALHLFAVDDEGNVEFDDWFRDRPHCAISVSAR